MLSSLVLTLILGAAPVAQTVPAKKLAAPAAAAPVAKAGARELRRRTLTLDDSSVTTLPELHVAKGTATVITFQTDIAEGGVMLGAVADLFHPIAQTTRMAVLAPKNDLTTPVPLNVQLRDGTILTFQCMTSRSDVDAQVDVVLKLTTRASADSAVALRSAIGSLRNQLDECRATSGEAGAQKLASLLLTQSLESPQAFDRRPLHTVEKQARLLVEAKWAYRLLGLTYIIILVENRDSEKTWVLDRAEVSLAGAKEKSDIKVTGTAAEYPTLAPDQAGRVVISFPTPAAAGAQKVTVTLYERDGGRTVALPALEI